MYRKSVKGWLKHFDFIILDLISLQVAFVLAYMIRHGISWPYSQPLYQDMALFLVAADIGVLFFFETLKNVLKRGYYREFAITTKHAVLVSLIAVLYLFTIQEGGTYSRIVIYITGVVYALLTYMVRLFWKKVLKKEGQMQTAGLCLLLQQAI